MPTTVCEACGASNPAEATFCQTCHAFVGWDRTSVQPAVPKLSPPPGRRPPAEEIVETRVVPKIIEPKPAPVEPGSVLTVRVEQDQVLVPVSGETAELAVMITNRSDIVDGYEVDVGGAPDWLKIESNPLRLLPGSEERLVLRLRIAAENLVPAGPVTIRLRVRSLTRAPAHQIIPITVVVPVVDAPVRLRTEPSIVRLTDVEVGRFVVVLDNGDANRPAQLRLSGSDPELAVDFHFDPSVVTVGPGESARVRAVTTSARPRPGTELTRTLTVSATEGKRRVDTTVTLLQATSAVVEDPMVELAVTPSLLRVRDADTATARLSVDNRAGRGWATVRLAASDPEQVVSAHWGATEVRVPPGGSSEVEVWLSCPPADPGSEVTHPVTLSASDGRRVARTQISLVHSTSASPMSTLGVHLDPSVLRFGTRRRGTSAVIVDNRTGRQPAHVWLRGDDPENAVGFTFTPPELTVGPGQVLTSRVAVSAPRAPSGRETTRSLTVAATDGRTAVTTTGTIIQTAGDRRPWARVVLTIAGGLAILLGAMRPFTRDRMAFLVNEDEVEQVFRTNLVGVPGVLSLGMVLLVLAGLMIFGLTGTTGRLTRWSALLAAAVLVAGVVIFSPEFGLGGGVLVIGIGCVLGYIGGLLVRR